MGMTKFEILRITFFLRAGRALPKRSVAREAAVLQNG
jgi:hypothetical protein